MFPCYSSFNLLLPFPSLLTPPYKSYCYIYDFFIDFMIHQIKPGSSM